MKKILITGANSYIGMSVENYLKQWPADYLVDTVDMIGDAWRSKDFFIYDVVFHVAGIAHSDSGKISPERAKKYFDVNTKLTVETAEKAKSEGVKQFIFMSSIIVFGDSSPPGVNKRITATTKPEPANAYGDSKLQAEIQLRKLQTTNFNICILRPPMIYGPGSKGNYPLLRKLARLLPVFPSIENERSMLFIEHLCELVKQMIDGNIAGTFHPQNDAYSSTVELVKLIASANGKKVYTTSLFNPVLKVLGSKMNIVKKAFGNLSYDCSLNETTGNYNKYTLQESIIITEKQVEHK